MKTISLLLILFFSYTAYSQNLTPANDYQNAASKMAEDLDKLTIGGYAQVDYNQPIESGNVKNGTLDVHRLVLLFGYKFNQRIQFITEIEMEHVNELYVEQAFLEYKLKDWIRFRGGLLLVPMGIINEYHEPPTFNGVERPSLDSYIIPTTWRELGAGITGVVRPANLKYQLYIINGFLGYDEKATFDGKNALRNGRQKGIESIIRFPNVSGKVEYYGIKGLNVGLSGYAGKSQSTLYKDVPKEGPEIESADSSVVGIAIWGIDARYNIKGFQARGQFNYGKFSNTEEYNAFTGSNFGSSMLGFYLEAGYNVFAISSKIKSQLIPFIRYENYDTQHSVAGNTTKDPAYHRNELTLGLGWKPVSGVALKADYQVFNNESGANSTTRLNLGVGVWF